MNQRDPRSPVDPVPPSKPHVPRRHFMVRAAAVVIGGIVGLVPLLAGAVVFFDPLRRKSAGGQWYRVGTLDGLKPGVPKRVTIIDDRHDAWTVLKDEPIGAVFLVANPDKTAVSAMNTTCPHAGCSVGYQAAKQSFLCPCHTSSFALDGTPTCAVPPRGMDTLDCEIRGTGEVWVKYQDFITGISEKTPKA